MSTNSRLILASAVVVALVAALLIGRTVRGWSVSPLEANLIRCRRGDGDSCARAGYAYLQGVGTEKDPARAYELFREGCSDLSALACFDEGVVLRDGTGVAKDTARAQELLHRSCDRGYETACVVSARLELSLAASDAAREQVIDELRRQCDLGRNKVCDDGGDVLWTGDMGLARDGASARKLFEVSCGRHDPVGCRKLGQALACGRGGPRDVPRAEQLLIDACRQKDRAACHQLSEFVEEGQGLSALEDPAFRDAWISAAVSLVGSRDDPHHALPEILRYLRANEPSFAKFLDACAAIDRGDFAGFQHVEGELRPLHPDPRVMEILEKLAGRRKHGERWLEALVNAWAEAGAPDLRGSEWFPDGRPRDFYACHMLSEPTGLTELDGSFNHFALYQSQITRDWTTSAPPPVPDEFVDEALAFSASTDAAVQLIALRGLELDRLNMLQSARARPVASQLRARLAKEHPDNLYFGLLPFCGSAEKRKPFTAGDIVKLHALAKLTYRPPRMQVADALARALHAAQPDLPRDRIFLELTSVVRQPMSCVVDRIYGLSPTVDQAALGAALLEVGQHEAEGTWLVEGMSGTYLELLAAGMINRQPERDRAAADRKRVQALYPNDGFMPELGEWPLPSRDDEELTRFEDDEVGTMRALLALVPAHPDGGAP